MYLPPAFREDDLAVLHEAMRRSRLATLVTARAEEGLLASHLPVLVLPEPAPFGTIIGHVARANPHARCDGAEALVIFTGPDAYVSPAWYPTKVETGKVVPTWNYVAVHAYGTLRTYEDPERLLELVSSLTSTHEGRRADPWAVSDAPADFVQSQLKGLTGLELVIERLEGKWKMSQNRPAEDARGAAAGLLREGGPLEAEVAGLVEDRNPR